MTSNYQRINNIVGWLVFAIATAVYFMTIEPTASFWDCGEYITTAFKLQVGHPPGAPLFQMLGRFFSLLAGGSPDKAAMMVNIMSALSSSFTILFLFWTITALGKKISSKNRNDANGNTWGIIGAGIVGSLAYTFSDSFWFSAVEGEVYAMSSFFTAIVFWAILKWESVVDNDIHADRWIIFIAYLVGLSVGVHLLNLLCIPAIVFIYYFKKYDVTRKGLIMAGGLSILILGGIQAGIIPWIVKLAAWFELFFVNSLSMPFNAGTIIYFLLLIGGVTYGLIHTSRNNKPILNTVILSFAMIMVGYSSFFVLVIRSNADTPLDENNPENAISLLAYLNREQYGDWPIMYGQYYNAPLDPQNPYKDGTPVYVKDEKSGKYVISDDRKQSIPNYDSRFCTVFPRMWSSQGSHISAYKQWGKIKGRPVQTSEGKKEIVPTFGENLRYFFTYQLGHMYIRYFMWNFVGRQNDIQGHGDDLDGNWITGIKFIDEILVGKQDALPREYVNNPGRNAFYGFPLILGLIGMFFHFKKDKQDAFVVTLLFFFTGLAIVVYLNQYPYQPRERDYAYAASFYAFAIWIGLGVMALVEGIKGAVPEKLKAILVTLLCTLAVPGLMAKDGWNDHDRSNRYVARDFAKNYLQSCAPNAILFTNGDNDTFPLWYVQEVEGFRTDVRVVNLSLLNTDWYIDQMKRKAYDSEPVPFSLTEEKYRQGTRDYVPFYDRGIEGYVPLKEVMQFVASDNPKDMLHANSGRALSYFPTSKFRIPVDKNVVLANKTVIPSMADRVEPSIDWELKKSYILKNHLMVLDLLATNNWNRPVYFAVTTGPDSYLSLQDYFQLEGLAFRLVPVKNRPEEKAMGTRVASDIMYDNIMNKFTWGGMENKNVYIDENTRRMATNMRVQMATLASTLVSEGKKDSAIKVLDKCIEMMPEENIPYDATIFSVTVAYFQAGANTKGVPLAKKVFEIFEEKMKYFVSIGTRASMPYRREMDQAKDIMQKLVYLTRNFKEEQLAKEFQDRATPYMNVGNDMPAPPPMDMMDEME